VHQGITTVVTGQCGVSPAPLAREHHRDTLATLSMFVSSLLGGVIAQVIRSAGCGFKMGQ